VIIIGNGSFVRDDNRRNESGFALLMNIADWLSQDKGLISIRSKDVGAGLLKETSDTAKKATKYINMFLMPLIVIVFGVIRWRVRKSPKKVESV
jgi:ABC-type uncharacterized transport system involved in gliding motility auxiliary subunit